MIKFLDLSQLYKNIYHVTFFIYLIPSNFVPHGSKCFLQPQSNFTLIFIGKERNKRIHSCLYMILVCQNTFTI